MVASHYSPVYLLGPGGVVYVLPCLALLSQFSAPKVAPVVSADLSPS